MSEHLSGEPCSRLESDSGIHWQVLPENPADQQMRPPWIASQRESCQRIELRRGCVIVKTHGHSELASNPAELSSRHGVAEDQTGDRRR
jgi:hypothetical protein